MPKKKKKRESKRTFEEAIFNINRGTIERVTGKRKKKGKGVLSDFV